MNEASTIFSLIHQTLSGDENELSVSMMCQTAGVSRSGYYAWLNAASARQVREAQDRADFELILEAYNRRRYSKGARGIYMCLIHNTPPVVMNLKRIRRLMKKYGLQCPIRRARRKILCKRNSTKSRMALEKQCRWRAESLGYPWPSVARRYARRRRECRRTSEGTLKQGVSRRHGRRT